MYRIRTNPNISPKNKNLSSKEAAVIISSFPSCWLTTVFTTTLAVVVVVVVVVIAILENSSESKPQREGVQYKQYGKQKSNPKKVSTLCSGSEFNSKDISNSALESKVG